MKRFVIVLAVLMLLPLNAFALQPMSEDNMGQITGQAGVSIAIDDVKIYQNIQSLTYTDLDGTTNELADYFDPNPAHNYTDAGAGAVSISNLSMMVNINAITEMTAAGPTSPGRATSGTYTAGVFNGTNNSTNALFLAKPLTIDVGEMAVLSEGLTNNDLTMQAAAAASGGAFTYTPLTNTTLAGVRIGLPTVEIVQSALTFDVTIGYYEVDAATGEIVVDAGTGLPVAAAYNSGASFGRISIGQQTIAVLDGFIEIAPH